MMYRVRHETRYDYEDPVSISHHILRLTPRNTLSTAITVSPRPPAMLHHDDYFGNAVVSFNLLEPHDRFLVVSTSELEVNAPPAMDFAASPAWETVAAAAVSGSADLDACQFVFDSSRARAMPRLRDYALESFPAARPLLQGVRDLTHRIHDDFRFDTKATEVSTPVETFFEKRRGVCQDFSHLQISCLRSIGLPARYVSGYLRTLPPPGRPRLAGADASHAWCAAWSPGIGWVDFDPTNDCVPTDGHITVAWGRDYGDVSPVYGVLLGGATHTLEVGVDVVPVGPELA
jgi:transglutaminase-like putative cysteine protease